MTDKVSWLFALPSGQSLLCIHSCISAPEGRWTRRYTVAPPVDFLDSFLALSGDKGNKKTKSH